MSAPIKVMMVVRPTAGGIRQHLSGLLSHLQDGRVEPTIVCPPDRPGVPSLDIPGVRTLRLNIQSDLTPMSDWAASLAISRLAWSEGVSIIHAHGFKAGFLCLWAGHRPSRPFTTVCTFHNPLRRHEGNPLKNAMTLSMASAVGRRVDHVVVISRALEEEALGLMRLPQRKVTCVYNGIDPDAFCLTVDPAEVRRELGIPAGARVVGTVARLIPQKGIQNLIHAAVSVLARVANAHVLVVGDGPFRGRLEEEASFLGIADRITFAGFRGDVPRILAALDVFALPSLEEGFSLAVLEAMASGKPVVATRTGGLPELVSPETGLLVPMGGTCEMAQALSSLLEDPERCVRMGQAGRARAKSRFSMQSMADEHLALYQRLTSGPPSPEARPVR